MEKTRKKLELKRQAIRELSPAELTEAQGGFITIASVTITIVFIPTPAH